MSIEDKDILLKYYKRLLFKQKCYKKEDEKQLVELEKNLYNKYDVEYNLKNKIKIELNFNYSYFKVYDGEDKVLFDKLLEIVLKEIEKDDANYEKICEYFLILCEMSNKETALYKEILDMDLEEIKGDYNVKRY